MGEDLLHVDSTNKFSRYDEVMNLVVPRPPRRRFGWPGSLKSSQTQPIRATADAGQSRFFPYRSTNSQACMISDDRGEPLRGSDQQLGGSRRRVRYRGGVLHGRRFGVPLLREVSRFAVKTLPRSGTLAQARACTSLSRDPKSLLDTLDWLMAPIEQRLSRMRASDRGHTSSTRRRSINGFPVSRHSAR